MIAFNQFLNLFEDVWIQGVFGINVSEIIIGLLITPSLSKKTHRKSVSRFSI